MAQRASLTVGICFGFFLLVYSNQVMAEEIKAASKITQVTIYPGAALVTREAQVDVPSGGHTVVFENIVPPTNENTLTVKGQGSAQVKIFGAAIKTEYLTQASDQRVKDLQAQIESLEDNIAVEHNQQTILDKQKEYLESVKLFAAQQIPKDLVTKLPAVSELEQTGSYLAKSFTDVLAQGEEIRLKLRELDRKKEALDRQLQELNSHNQNVKRSITVELEGIQAGQLTLTVSYLVNQVNWHPLYDARVAFEKNQVDLALFGLVSQTTGEDWSDVRLTISTARPSLAGMMPELSSWTLRPYEPPAVMQKNRAYGTMRASMETEGSSGEIEDKAIDALAPVARKQNVAEIAYAQTEQKGISVVFKITKPVTIKSDGSQQRVPITALTLPAQFEYAATPKLSTYAYLRSQVENNQEATLLPGPVNVFLDGDYVGASVIAKAIGNKEKFDLYLGADEAVTVKRELVEEESDDTLIGNIPSPNKVNRYSYKITAENYKSKAISINIFDHVPVSTDDKIKIKDLKFTPEPTQKDYKDRKGVVLWTMTLNPQEKKEMKYTFTVEHPRNLNVEGL